MASIVKSINDKLFINSAGNVGIGTTAPDFKLDVNGDVRLGTSLLFSGTNSYPRLGRSTNDLTFQTDASAEVMRITNAGNVGIGSTAPAAKLNVASTGANAYSSTITKGTNMKGIINALSNNADDMVGIYFGTGTTSEGTHWSGITGSRSNSAADWSTQLNFYTHDENVSNITDATQKMVIKGSGNVGIGTTSPGQKLTVIGTAAAYSAIGADDNVRTGLAHYDTTAQGAGVGGQLVLGYKYIGDTDYTEGAIIKMYKENGTSGQFGSGLKFQVRNNGANLSTKVIINPSGNVGIGTTAPDRRLNVVSSDDTRGIMVEQTLASSYAEVHFKASREYRIGTGGSTSAAEAANNWYVYDATAAAQRFVITAAGNVGIGTTAPTNIIHVVGVPRFDSPSDPPTRYTGALDVDRYYGTNEGALTSPEMWLKIDIDGTSYLIPAFAI